MSGWVPFPADAWPVAVASLPDDVPWADELAAFDLRWFLDQHGGLPRRAELARRWGWAEHDVRALVEDRDLWFDSGRGAHADLDIDTLVRFGAGWRRKSPNRVATNANNSDGDSGFCQESPETCGNPPRAVEGRAPSPSPPPPPSPSGSTITPTLFEDPAPPAPEPTVAAVVVDHRKPKAPRPPKPRKPGKDGIDPAWLKKMSDVWAKAWNGAAALGASRGRYPWQLEGRDRHLLVQIAEAAGIEKNVDPTEAQVDELIMAFERYLTACDSGEAWPREPPTIGGFALKAPTWFVGARGPPRSRRGAHPEVVSAMPTEAELDKIVNETPGWSYE